MDIYCKYADELERSLRLRTYPIALKLLEREEDIPEGAERPMRDFNYHLSLCQAFSRSRRVGTNIYSSSTEGKSPSSPTIVMLKEDMWCPEPVIGYGLAEAPQYFMDGHTHFPATRRTLESAKAWAHAFPRLETGKYIGIASAPLNSANFEPQLVLVYCDSAQISLLILAAGWKSGAVDFPCRLAPSSACVRAVVPVVKEGKCQVTLPCWGDRACAMAQDWELIFSIPVDQLEDILLGLRVFGGTGRKMPVQVGMWPEHEMPESCVKIGRMMGMEWV